VSYLTFQSAERELSFQSSCSQLQLEKNLIEAVITEIFNLKILNIARALIQTWNSSSIERKFDFTTVHILF